MRAIYTLRAGRVRVCVWPRSFPWLLEVGRRQWWLFDRSQNLAASSPRTGRRKGRTE